MNRFVNDACGAFYPFPVPKDVPVLGYFHGHRSGFMAVSFFVACSGYVWPDPSPQPLAFSFFEAISDVIILRTAVE